MRLRLLLLSLAFACLGSRTLAWDYAGHRAINQLALAGLPADFPTFTRTPAAAERIAFLSGEPDRWRNTADLALKHVNSPDHFIDFEDLAPLGLTAETLDAFRYDFVGRIAVAHAAHPEQFPTPDPAKNLDRTSGLVGFLPWTITEHTAKLRSAFSYLKAYEEAGTPEEIANAQANIITLMGVMGHYIGDGAQPLHTTHHHNGWIGPNPNAYTTWTRFHAWIDGGFLEKIGYDFTTLFPRARPAQLLTLAAPSPDTAATADPVFRAVITYLLAQHAQVEPLYALDKTLALKADNAATQPAGREFLEEQLLRGGAMLSSLWLTAWQRATPDIYLKAQLLKRPQPLTSPPPP
jgi:hypothetical protein